MKKISKKFFLRPTLIVAEDLIGKVIISKTPFGERCGRIIETEAYIGEDDKACHARHGRTKRNEPLYKEGGRIYVYLCYGLFNLLNFVTERAGFPAAILIRKIEPLSGLDPRLKSYGPGNLTKYLSIGRDLNDKSLPREDLFIIDDGFETEKILHKRRVGIDYAGDYAKKKWRFVAE